MPQLQSLLNLGPGSVISSPSDATKVVSPEVSEIESQSNGMDVAASSQGDNQPISLNGLRDGGLATKQTRDGDCHPS